MRQVFKGDNYSREETIRGNTVSGSHARDKTSPTEIYKTCSKDSELVVFLL